MIIVLKPNCTVEQLNHFTEGLKHDYDVKVNAWVGTQSTVLGLIGDTPRTLWRASSACRSRIKRQTGNSTPTTR